MKYSLLACYVFLALALLETSDDTPLRGIVPALVAVAFAIISQGHGKE